MESIDQRILHLMYDGLTDEAIARRLHMGRRTVQRRIERLMEAFAVTSRFSLGATVERLGLLEHNAVPGQTRGTLVIDQHSAT